MKAHIFKATCVVLLSLARLPEILLKTQPALLHLSLLLCDAGGQCRVEIRQLGPAHVQHLPHTGLQVRQGRLLRRFRGLQAVPYHDLPSDVTQLSVSDVVRLFGGRRVFPLEDQRHGEREQREHARER